MVDQVSRSWRRIFALAGLLLALPASSAFAASAVHLHGTVYTFDNQDPIAGATVRVDELPGLQASSGADGSYDLKVPDGTRITPYVEAEGHHGIYLQTLVTQGRKLDRLNFQVPTTGTYNALAALLGVPLDAAGNPAECVVVSTFSTVNIRDASFDQFVAYGAHGVAGATATATPTLPSPIYFNESVIPDASRTQSSDDGGVIWTGVPAGVYRFHAEHPTSRFADFIATCEPGRLVNANPPWGFFELREGEVNDEAVDATLVKAKVESTDHRRRLLKVKVESDEYVSVAAELRRGAKTLATAAQPEGSGAFATGRQKISMNVRPKVDAGRAKLAITVDDANGNSRVISKRVKLPSPR